MRTRFLFITAVAAIAAVACAKVEFSVNEGQSINAPQTMTFKAFPDNGLGTKTSLDGLDVKWAAGETIYLFDKDAPRAFTSSNDAVAASVDFTGTAVASDKYYAVYPSGTISGSVVTATIPVIQAATANSCAPKANVAVAFATTDPTGANVLHFKNVGAVVKLQLSNDDVRKVRLDALGGTKIAGAMDITFDGEGNFNSAIVDAKAEECVVLDGGASDLSAATPYYIVIKPGTYAGGFKLTLIKEDGKYKSFTNATSNTLARNELMDFGTLPAVSSWKEGGAVDVITRETTGITSGSSSYSDWSGKTATSSAVYAGNSAGQNDAVQIRSKNNNSGIITTTSGGKVAKVSVVWNANTVAGRKLDVYGKNSAYSAATDLYGDAEAQGTLLGSITKGTSTELSIDGDYTYIGLRSNADAMFLDQISITWGGDATPVDPEVAAPSTAITNLSSATVALTDGSATFDVESNVPWTVSVDQAYASVSVSGNTVTVSFTDLAEGSRTATVTVTPSEGSPVEQEFTQTNPPSSYEIDFEGTAGSYTDWTFTNMTSQGTETIPAPGGTYYGGSNTRV